MFDAFRTLAFCLGSLVGMTALRAVAVQTSHADPHDTFGTSILALSLGESARLDIVLTAVIVAAVTLPCYRIAPYSRSTVTNRLLSTRKVLVVLLFLP